MEHTGLICKFVPGLHRIFLVFAGSFSPTVILISPWNNCQKRCFSNIHNGGTVYFSVHPKSALECSCLRR